MPQATDDLRRLTKPVAQRTLHKLKWLSVNFGNLIASPMLLCRYARRNDGETVACDNTKGM